MNFSEEAVRIKFLIRAHATKAVDTCELEFMEHIEFTEHDGPEFWAYARSLDREGYAYVFYDSAWHEPILLFPRKVSKKEHMARMGLDYVAVLSEIEADNQTRKTKEKNMLMKFDPATGEEKPYPSEANQYRAYHGKVAWLFNPYSGARRDARDVGSDCFGHAIVDLAEVRLFTERDKDAK